MNVDTIEKDDNGELWAYLVWNQKNEDNRFNRSKARVPTCNKACPQRMLQFYEKHVYVSFPTPLPPRTGPSLHRSCITILVILTLTVFLSSVQGVHQQ